MLKKERLLMTKPQEKKKKNQGFHYQVPFVDDSKEKMMVPFVDAFCHKRNPGG